MSTTFQVSGLTTIPPEVLDDFRGKCKLDQLTLGCLKKQLELGMKMENLFAGFTLFVNNSKSIDLQLEIFEEDIVQILPIIAGG